MSVDVTNDGAITGVLTGGTFAGFTISGDEIDGRKLTITAEDFDLTTIDLASLELALLVVDEGASVSKADLKNSVSFTFQNKGKITGGTFNGIVWNYETIRGGTFNGSVGNMGSAVIQGADESVPQINGNIYFNQSEARILQPCAFGPNASVTAENNEGAIQVTMTVNGENRTFQYGEKVLDALNGIRSGADWCAVEGDKRTPVKAEDAFGLQSRSYNYTYYPYGSWLYITAPVFLSQDMIPDGVWRIKVTQTGEITGSREPMTASIEMAKGGKISGGEFAGDICSEGTISGGAFSGKVTNNGTVTGGTFDGTVDNNQFISGGVFNGSVLNSARDSLIQGDGETTPKLNGEISNKNDYYEPRILQPCDFGPSATVKENTGTIEVMVTVNDVEMKVNYGANILEALGESFTGLWYRVNADGTRALVREGDTFASLQGETYTSQVLLAHAEDRDRL